MRDVVLRAWLPMTISVNSSTGGSSDGGRYKTLAARAAQDEIVWILNTYQKAINKSVYAPYKVIYINQDILQEIQRPKKRNEKRYYYIFDTVSVFVNWKGGDLDNPWKDFQDVLAGWCGFNDNYVVDIHNRKIIDNNASKPYIKTVLLVTDELPNGNLDESYDQQEELIMSYKQPYYRDGVKIATN